jgi:hypothetical protein
LVLPQLQRTVVEPEASNSAIVEATAQRKRFGFQVRR